MAISGYFSGLRLHRERFRRPMTCCADVETANRARDRKALFEQPERAHVQQFGKPA